MDIPTRAASGGIKLEFDPDEEQLEAIHEDLYHYRFNLFDFLQKRKGGGGSSSRGGGGSRSSSGGRTFGVSNPFAGSSPGKPKSPPLAPPKAPPKLPKIPTLPKTPKVPKPTLPKIPKVPRPKSGGNPPKGSVPGSRPGYPPYHGSGGHDHDHDRPPPVRSCVHPKGMERLRCEKADAIIVTISAIMGLLLALLVIFLCISRLQRIAARRKNHEEDGTELTEGVNNHESDPQTERGTSASDVDPAISIPQERVTPPQKQARDLSSGSDSSWYEHSIPRVRNSLSSGMIRTAMYGQALQDPTLIDVPPPSLAGSKKDAARRCSTNENLRSVDGSTRGDDGEGTNRADDGAEWGDEQRKAGRRWRRYSRGSWSPVSKPESDEESHPNDAGSRCSSRRSSSHGHSDQLGNEVDTPGDATSRHSVSRPSLSASRH